LAVTAGKRIAIAAQNLLASLKNGLRLYVHADGGKIIAADQNIDIEAQKNNIKIFAQISIEKVAPKITLTARKKITLNGGGSSATWQAGQIKFATAGSYTVHRAGGADTGPKSSPPKTPSPPTAPLKAQLLVSLEHAPLTASGLYQQYPVKLYKNGAMLKTTLTDTWGRVAIDDVKPGDHYEVEFANGERVALKVQEAIKNSPADRMAYRGFHHDGHGEQGLLRQMRPDEGSEPS